LARQIIAGKTHAGRYVHAVKAPRPGKARITLNPGEELNFDEADSDDELILYDETYCPLPYAHAEVAASTRAGAGASASDGGSAGAAPGRVPAQARVRGLLLVALSSRR